MAEDRTRIRSSLWSRLAIGISVLLIVLGATLTAAAYWEARRVLLGAGGERLTAAGRQLSSLLTQSAATRVAEMQRLAGDPAVAKCLSELTTDRCGPARAVLQAYADRNTGIAVALREATGKTLLAVTSSSGQQLAGDPSSPPVEGFGPFVTNGKQTTYEIASQIQGAPGINAYVVVRRALAAASAGDLLGPLIGGGVRIKVGDAGRGVWTDLSTIVAAPPAHDVTGRIVRYSADGAAHLGSAAEVRGTPWQVWVEVPEAMVLAPARNILRQMLPVTLFIVLAGVVFVGILARHVTTPLLRMTDAAEAMAAGDFSRRVSADRRDEVGRLGSAFNAMVERVAESHEALEARVLTHELEQARQELDQFFALSLDLLCIAGMDGRFRRVNPAWEAVLGWTAADLTTIPYLDLVHPDDQSATTLEAAHLSKGGTTVSFENRYRCKDGSYRWLSWKATPLPSQGLIYAAARDVTDEKQIARNQQNHAEELANANRELEAFSYSVSHDLRAPLRHLAGFAVLLEKSAGGRLDEQQRRYLKTIHDSAAHMGRLIDDLLGLSRLGRAELRRTQVDLNQTVAEAKREVDSDTNASGVEWVVGSLPSVAGDPALLRVAFVNLLSNAVKYSRTRAHPRIEISADGATADEVVVYVRDNGVGFDMQYAHKLFGVFQRLHRREEFDGTGIGLATVRRIVGRHGGRVWADAAVDAGATFFVAMPRGGSIDDHHA